jgi:hypothetical protein
VKLGPSSLLLLLAVPASVPAGSFSGDATTIFRVYDLVQDPELLEGPERVTPYRPLDQYLRLSWDELGARGAWTVDVSARGRTDLGGDPETQEDFRILHAKVSWRSPRRLVDLSFGRLRSVVGLGWQGFDGLRLDFRKHRLVKLFVQAGLPVDLADSGAPGDDGFTWAGGIAFNSPRHGSVGLDYELRRFDGLTTEETFGLDFDFASGRFSLAGNADYSVPNDRFGETTVVAAWRLERAQRLEARVTRIEPVLPTDSIFAVFTINPYTETRLSWERRGKVSLGAFVSRENYENTDREGDEDISRAAVTLRFDKPRRAKHRAEMGWQDGFSGDRLGLRYDMDYDLNPRWRLGGGASLNRHENAFRLTEADEEVALRARLSYDHHGRFDVAVSVDQYLGRDRDTTRGQLIFRAKLGRARRERPWWGGQWGAAWAGGSAPRSESSEAVEAQ